VGGCGSLDSGLISASGKSIKAHLVRGLRGGWLLGGTGLAGLATRLACGAHALGALTLLNVENAPKQLATGLGDGTGHGGLVLKGNFGTSAENAEW
jgi:hypothetical protein